MRARKINRTNLTVRVDTSTPSCRIVYMSIKMSKTEAAETIACQVEVFARKAQQPVTRDSVWEALSECGAGHRGEYLAAAAAAANYKTVLRIVNANLKLMGEYHLIAT